MDMIAAVDLSDPDTFVGGTPHEYFTHLRAHDPVHWQQQADGTGYWAVTRHADVATISRAWEDYSSWRKGVFTLEDPSEEVLRQIRTTMINMDPPRHTRLRKIVNKAFTPRAVAQLQQHINDIAVQTVDALLIRDECDFVNDVAMLLPVTVICEMMGIPRADWAEVIDWTNVMASEADPEFAVDEHAVETARRSLVNYGLALAADRRKTPTDDIVNMLLTADVDGESLSDGEFVSFFILLTSAGNETTRNALAHGTYALLQDRDQWNALIQAGQVDMPAVDEMLRWATPVMRFVRTAQHTVDLSGTTIAEGDKVAMYYCSANRDEAVFNDPHTFDIARSVNPHVTFGSGGTHFCLGANLARLEMRVLMTELIRRVPSMHTTGTPDYLRSNFLHAMKRLPVGFSHR